MDLATVKAFLEEQKANEEVKSYIQGFLTSDGVNSYLESEEGKKLLQPKLDSHFHKGLETWKANNLEKLISEEISNRNPSETPDQKRIRELEEKIAKSDAEILRKDLRATATDYLSEKKLPNFFVEQLLGNDEESTKANLTKFEEVWGSQIKSVRDEILKENGTTINEGSSGGQGSTGDFFSVIKDNQTRKQ
ncbi:DUF4355 domain-containing protein [Peribacillus sp. NPDC097198]|uniref:DUF4355 domain-containing protein n=1 Tax=Peribacillus sp. NPDC097198 TaxID=3364397 RepID=UPI0037FA2E5D